MTQVFLLKQELKEIKLCSFQGFEIWEYPFNLPHLRYQLIDPSKIVVSMEPLLETVIEELDKRLK